MESNPLRIEEDDIRIIDSISKMRYLKSQEIRDQRENRFFKNRYKKRKIRQKQQREIELNDLKFRKKMDKGEIQQKASMYSKNLRAIQNSSLRKEKDLKIKAQQ